MISRYIFVSFYFICLFTINRWYDLYQYYFYSSPHNLFPYHIQSANQLSVKQLQHILSLRGIAYININEKYDLIRMVDQTGEYRESLYLYFKIYWWLERFCNRKFQNNNELSCNCFYNRISCWCTLVLKISIFVCCCYSLT